MFTPSFSSRANSNTQGTASGQLIVAPPAAGGLNKSNALSFSFDFIKSSVDDVSLNSALRSSDSPTAAPMSTELLTSLKRQQGGVAGNDRKKIDYLIEKRLNDIQTATLEVAKVRLIPRAIQDQLRLSEYDMFMGFIPEVNRAWIASDNRLFLWNYDNPNSDDFTVFEDLDQLIVSVGYVMLPPSGKQNPQLDYLIIVATPVQVLALKPFFDPISHRVDLARTDLSISTDNVPMLCITGTSTGKIFMGGSDGLLYEFAYQSPTSTDDSWTSLGLKKKCHKVEYSQHLAQALPGPLSWWLPSFIASRIENHDPIISIVVDNQRGVFYTVSEQESTISMYRFLSFIRDENSSNIKVEEVYPPRFVSTVMHLRTLVKEFVDEPKTKKLNHGLGPSIPDRIKIIKLDVVPKSESHDIHFVCTTQTGVRIYFSNGLSAVNSNEERAKISIVYIKGPPNFEDNKNQAENASKFVDNSASAASYLSNRKEIITTSFYSNGLFVLALAPSIDETKDGKQLISCSTDFGARLHDDLSSIWPPEPWKLPKGHYEIVNEDVLFQGESLLAGRMNLSSVIDRVFEICESEEETDPDTYNLLQYIEGFVRPGRLNVSNYPLPKSIPPPKSNLPLEQKPNELFSELVLQYTIVPRRRIYLLGQRGVWLLVKNRPINQLYSIFEMSDKLFQKERLEDFFRTYGLDEGCAMCLAIAIIISSPNANSSRDGIELNVLSSKSGFTSRYSEASATASSGVSPSKINPEARRIARLAMDWFIELGYGTASQQSKANEKSRVLPAFKSASSGTDAKSKAKTSSFGVIRSDASERPGSEKSLIENEILYSGCYLGLKRYALALLSPFWNHTIFLGDKPLSIRFNASQLETIKEPLEELKNFMEFNQPFSKIIDEQRKKNSIKSSLTIGKMKKTPNEIEAEKIYSIFVIVDLMTQLFSLFAILQSESVPLSRMLSRICDMGNANSENWDITWSSIVSTPEGHELVNIIIRCWAEEFIGDRTNHSAPLGLNILTSRLREKSPVFFREGEMNFLLAQVEKKLAESDSMQSKAHVNKAFGLYRSSFDNLFSSPSMPHDWEIKNAVTNLITGSANLFSLGSRKEALDLGLYAASLLLKKTTERQGSSSSTQMINLNDEYNSGQSSDALIVIRVMVTKKYRPTKPDAMIKAIESLYSSTVDANQRLLLWRMVCYSIVTQILEEISNDSKNSTEILRTASTSATMTLLDALNYVLRSDIDDKLWHYWLYYFLFVEKQYNEYLLKIKTKYVDSFFEMAIDNAKDVMMHGPGSLPIDSGNDLPNKNEMFDRWIELTDFHARWLSENRKFGSASRIMYEIATLDIDLISQSSSFFKVSPGTLKYTIQQRIQYLRLAATYARNQASYNQLKNIANSLNSSAIDDEEVGEEFLMVINDDIDMAEIQEELLNELELLCRANPKNEKYANTLDSIRWVLRDSSFLYNDVAFECKLWLQCLKIILACNAQDQDDEVREIYREAFESLQMKSSSTNQLGAAKAKLIKFGELYKKAGNSIFPCDFLIQLLEGLTVPFIIKSLDAELHFRYWVVESLVEIGIEYRNIFDHYHGLSTSDTITGDTKLAIAESLCYLIDAWLSHNEGELRIQARDVSAKLTATQVSVVTISSRERASKDYSASVSNKLDESIKKLDLVRR